MSLDVLSGDPACWQAADVQDSSRWLLQLSPDHIEEIESAVAMSSASGQPIEAIDKAGFPLASLGPILDQLHDQVVQGLGFGVIRGLPVGEYSRDQVMRAYFGIGSYIGSARPQNGAGHLIGHVRDLGEDYADPKTRIYRTNARQRFHVDSCDVVALLCLHPAKSGGHSYLCSSLAIMAEISRQRPDLAKVLAEPFIYDRKGEIPEGKQPHYPIPILNQQEDKASVYFARDFIESAQARFADIPRLSEAQIEALDRVEELAESKEFRLSLEFRTGDIQFVHNHVLLHSREAYIDFGDPGRKRHLLRLWLSPHRPRPLPTTFEERYGPIMEGKPRGGIFVPGSNPIVAFEAE